MAELARVVDPLRHVDTQDRKSTRLNSSHSQISYAVFCLKKKNHILRCCHLGLTDLPSFFVEKTPVAAIRSKYWSKLYTRLALRNPRTSNHVDADPNRQT